MGLNEKQKEAVEYLEGPLLVLAGPGTGKTQLLSEKVAYILKNLDAQPENILCMTFTESGVSNMKERLKSIIGPEGAKVHVNTYHSFGSEILAEYRNYAEVPERKMEEPIDELRRFKIVKEIQGQLPGNDILQKDNVKDIIDVISKAKAAGLAAEDLALIAEQNIEDSKVLSEQISPLLENVVPRNYERSRDEAYLPIFDLLRDYTEAPIIVKNIERSIGVLARDLKDALAEAEEAESVKPLSDWKDKYFEKDGLGEYRLKDRNKNKKLASVAVVMKKYTEFLAENGLFDFDDMILEAVRALKKDAGFRATLTERYQFIMLDEFQDTNPSQFAIIKELTDYEKPLVMAVGDDDQAIYEFQGARSTNLTDFQRHYESHVIALTENYRSTQEILDFSRQVINQASDRFADKELTAHREASSEGSQIYRYEFLSSELEYSFVAGEISRLVKAGVSQSEIAVISCKHKFFEPLLKYLKACPELKIAYEKRDNLFEDEAIYQILTISRYVYELANEKRVDTNIMEVLTYPFWGLPTVKVVRMIQEAKRKKTAIFEEIFGEEDGGLGNSEGAKKNEGGASKLTKNDDSKEQRVNRGEKSASVRSLGRVSEAKSTATITENDGFEGRRSEKGASKIAGMKEIGEFLGGLVVASFNEPLEVFLNYVLGETELNGFRSPFLRYYQEKGEFELFTLYENLAVLRGKLKQHFGDKKLRLADLIEMVRDYEEASMTLTVTSPYRDGAEAVQVLTAHKAKGLEFRYVFILGADHTSWGKGKGNNNGLALPANLTQIRHTGVTDGEKLRVLYVALTRAKEALYITNSRYSFKDKKLERLEYFEEYENAEKEVVSPFLPSKFVRQTDVATSGAVLPITELKNWLVPFIDLTPDMREIYRERVANFRMSASALTSFIDIVYSGPREFFKNYVLSAPYTAVTESQVFGSLIHAVFEAVTTKGVSDEKAIELFREEVLGLDFTEEAKRRILEKGIQDLVLDLGRFGEVLRSGKAEVDFSAEHLVVEGVPITGKIDHLVIDEDAKTIKIYDFKTGKFKDKAWEGNETLYKYMLQLGFYKLLLNNSAKYKDYKVTEAEILFVAPDDDGEVHRKLYKFSDEAEGQLIELMKAVYSSVVNLGFLDEEVFIEADSDKGIKDIKEFVKVLLDKN